MNIRIAKISADSDFVCAPFWNIYWPREYEADLLSAYQLSAYTLTIQLQIKWIIIQASGELFVNICVSKAGNHVEVVKTFIQVGKMNWILQQIDVVRILVGILVGFGVVGKPTRAPVVGVPATSGGI